MCSSDLGLTRASDLPWEFEARIRPWFQPLVYYAIARLMMLLSITDMFDIVFVLRLLTGLFSLAALAAFAKAILPTIAGEDEKRAFLGYLPLFGFLPYLFVRTSSETFSAAFFALGLAVVCLGIAAVGICAALAPFWATPPIFLGGTAAAGGIALINAIGNLGGFLGPYLVGWIKDATHGYGAAMAFLGCGLVTSAATMGIAGRVLLRQTARSAPENA